jgi:ABC-type dipeptide/oligopeptide/nickel transport system permease component
MREGGTRSQDAAVLLVIAAVVLGLLLARNGASWLRSLTASISAALTDPLTLAVVVLLVVAAVTFAVLRVVVTRRLLADRVALAVLPSESFDPTPEAVVAFAAGLGRVRRARLGWLAPRACAVRVRLASLPGGRMLYVLEVPRSTLGVLRAAVAVYDGVELRDPASLDLSTLEVAGGHGAEDEPNVIEHGDRQGEGEADG